MFFFSSYSQKEKQTTESASAKRKAPEACIVAHKPGSSSLANHSSAVRFVQTKLTTVLQCKLILKLVGVFLFRQLDPLLLLAMTSTTSTLT